MSALTFRNPEPAGGTKRLGRFELKKVLGRGAQATVWLGYDARLDREVAVKILSGAADAVSVSAWLHEARAVSRLTHPNIVPVFEADEQQGQSYLVFEYVKGPTLSELLRQRGALPARQAATLVLGVLDALKAAHDIGVVHRDLKPSNILVDREARARVMDFGIAARLSDAHDERIYGTPGYISPEAARGEAPVPAMDVFAAGVLLGEMLSGRPLLIESDPYRAIDRVQVEDLGLPASMPNPVDDGLRAVVMRAIARHKSLRFASADEFHAALAQWLNPETVIEPSSAAGGNGTLEFLLRRMKHKSDFPALSDAVGRIQKVANSENDNLSNLADEILKDVALTNKLLRLVNTAHFSAAGGPVSTVSRAIALIGFAGIRNMALSLVLLEHMQDKVHAQTLKEEFLRSLMSGALAHELSIAARDGEEAFLTAMFQGLGRLLTAFYFPEEAEQINALLRPIGKTNGLPPPSEEAASHRVLGTTYEELGIGVAKSWGLPDSLQRGMRRPGNDMPAKPPERGVERHRWLGQLGNDVADALLNAPDPASRIAQIGARYAKVLGIDAGQLKAASDAAQARLSQLAQAMQIKVGPTARAQRLLTIVAEQPPADTLTGHQLQATLPSARDGEGEGDTMVLDPAQPAQPAGPRHVIDMPPGKVSDMLAAGIQDITNHMVSDGFKLNEVLRMILETMFRALDFRRVVFCLRDPKTEMLTGRFGLGESADVVSAAFKVPLKPVAGLPPDLFTAVCLKGADTLIADATVAQIASRMPPWFRQQVNAPAFLLLPLSVKNAPLGLIYADKAEPGGIALGEKELSLLRTLRNQAVMAFRQAS